MYVFAAIEHANRRIRILGATAHLIRDRDGKFPQLFDEVIKEAGIEVVLSSIRMPRMNSIMERRLMILLGCRSIRRVDVVARISTIR